MLLNESKELYLNGNQLVSLEGLPSFPLLEVLVLSQNHLESLKGMPHLPKLKALFLSSNQLSSFEGIPVCNNLIVSI
jgi:Leucine-rich repeat (LRR) protein